MKQTILAIFAHPDDESFGPSGTLSLLAASHDVVLTYVTAGEACSIPEKYSKRNIATLRKNELKKAAKHLGITTIEYLNFPDGYLSNKLYSDIRAQLATLVQRYQPTTLISFEPRGFSGHLDHIAVTSVTQHIFYNSHSIDSMHLFAINRNQRKLLQNYYVHFPEGYHLNQINTIINIESAWEKKMKAIAAYQSQVNDRTFWLPMLSRSKRQEHFLSYYRTRRHPLTSLLHSKHLIKTGKSLLCNI